MQPPKTHLHLGLGFAASGLKLLLVVMRLGFDLLGRQVSPDVLRVQVGAGGRGRRGYAVLQTGSWLRQLKTHKAEKERTREKSV